MILLEWLISERQISARLGQLMDSLIQTYQKMTLDERSTIRTLVTPVPRFLYLYGILTADQQDILLVRMDQIDSENQDQGNPDGLESGVDEGCESEIDGDYEISPELDNSLINHRRNHISEVFGEYPSHNSTYQNGDNYEGDSPCLSREVLDQEMDEYWRNPCPECHKGICKRGPLKGVKSDRLI